MEVNQLPCETDNFIEVSTIIEANMLDTSEWSFIGYSQRRDVLMFKRKVRKGKK